MAAIPVIAIFDAGKTNKKLLLFDQQYRIVFERSARLPESVDDDGDPCEDTDKLRSFVFDSLAEVFNHNRYEIKAANFSAYGASFVLLGKDGETIAPLYNYLKPYDEDLRSVFYNTYGGENGFSGRTASPVLGNLNSGMQLYRIKYQKPEVFKKLHKALHLPQYLGFLLTGKYVSDLTSIGCHTNLWDFDSGRYHPWVHQEGINEKLAPIVPADTTYPVHVNEHSFVSGIGLHDSSAALIPYLVSFRKPFVLLSTGTWCISLNPFNNHPLTIEELKNDCLSYISYLGNPVKASRLFAGHEHEQQVNRIAGHFITNTNKYRTLDYDPELMRQVLNGNDLLHSISEPVNLSKPVFANRDLSEFKSDEEAYYRLIADLVCQQHFSTMLVLKNTGVKQLYVDGGFSNNSIYMHLLATAFPELEVYAASMPQATALGAALVIHNSWNDNQVPQGLIGLTHYPAG